MSCLENEADRLTPYVTKLSKKGKKILLEALNEIAIETGGDTAIWAVADKAGKTKFYYAPHLCKRSEETKENFLEQFSGESKEMASKILKFVEQGYIG